MGDDDGDDGVFLGDCAGGSGDRNGGVRGERGGGGGGAVFGVGGDSDIYGFGGFISS